jgi:hypothetical protein
MEKIFELDFPYCGLDRGLADHGNPDRAMHQGRQPMSVYCRSCPNFAFFAFSKDLMLCADCANEALHLVLDPINPLTSAKVTLPDVAALAGDFSRSATAGVVIIPVTASPEVVSAPAVMPPPSTSGAVGATTFDLKQPNFNPRGAARGVGTAAALLASSAAVAPEFDEHSLSVYRLTSKWAAHYGSLH